MMLFQVTAKTLAEVFILRVSLKFEHHKVRADHWTAVVSAAVHSKGPFFRELIILTLVAFFLI